MCGIAGFFDPSRTDPRTTLQAMCGAIRHRGPDEDGYLVRDGCAIGMRRLSIIDLDTGRQPIANEDHTAWIVFNGEIYNFQDLRKELSALGHRFLTRSDTETIIHLYEQWGVAGLRRLRGMFSFAILDIRRNTLLLARDRLGKKPLYYAARGRTLYFGSELKALRAAGIPMHVDPESLRWYFLLNHIPDPFTVYQGVRKLPPGGWLTFDFSGRLEEGRFWTMPVPASDPPPGLSRQNAILQLRDMFDEAVRIRMVSDVPIGAFLSGGIDSSLVVATLARYSPEPVRTFSIGFEESAFDETPYARMVAARYNTQHHEILVRPDSVAMVDRIVDSFDEPFSDPSAIPTYYLCEFAARHVKVALSGDGGDEFFNGYESFLEIAALAKWDSVPVPARRLLRAVGESLPYAAYGKNYLGVVSQESSFARYLSRYAPSAVRRLLLPGWRVPDAAHLIRALPEFFPGNGHPPLTEAVFFEAAEKLPGDILVKVDRMSMACSLEVRCPLLDHHLAEFALSLPHHWKQSRNKGKTILIEALGGRLPHALLSRPKAGFAVPLDQWFRATLRDYLHDHLLGRAFLHRGIVSEPVLRQLIAEHERGRRDHGYFFWSLLMLALWFDRFDSGRGIQAA